MHWRLRSEGLLGVGWGGSGPRRTHLALHYIIESIIEDEGSRDMCFRHCDICGFRMKWAPWDMQDRLPSISLSGQTPSSLALSFPIPVLCLWWDCTVVLRPGKNRASLSSFGSFYDPNTIEEFEIPGFEYHLYK